MVSLKIKVKAEYVEDALGITEEEQQFVQEVIGVALRKFKKPARQLKFIYEKFKDNDKLFTYALINLNYTIGYLVCKQEGVMNGL